jgi:hypothetical protein
VLIVSHQQWLLRFHWKERFYKKKCLSFELLIALFIFNLFEKELNWILSFFLHWNVRHYLNNFEAVFFLKHRDQMREEERVYIALIDVLSISRNESKNIVDTTILVFEIKIDSNKFIVRLFKKKLVKAVSLTREVLNISLITLNVMQSLIEFLFFYS